MHLNLLAFAVPLFVGFMLLEYYVSRKKGLRHFQFSESVANINVGIAERLADLYTTGLFYFVFAYIYEHFALFRISDNVWSWLFLFLLTDLVWYWYHRLGHKVNLFWSAHVVHHQSEDFNYTVSVRITVFQALARSLFWAVLPLLGFHPAAITVMLLIHGAYPFFTHTQVVGKLGFLEYFLVTPSHHRVHHSSNPEYLDKNFGDVLIIWDKLFGTFAVEQETPVYGLTKPLESHSFLWQHFHFMLELGVALHRSKSLKERLGILFGKPDDIDPRIRGWLEKKLLRKNEYRRLSPALYNYIRVQTIVTLLALFGTLLLEYYLRGIHLCIIALLILVSIINTGAMLEQKRWMFSLDFMRLGLLVVLLYSYFPTPSVAMLGFSVLTMSLVCYRTLSDYYFRYFFREANV